MKDIPMPRLKLNKSSGFKVECILSSSSQNSVNFCSIFKDNVSKSKLKFFLSTET